MALTANTEPYKDSTFMDILYGSGVFTLDLAKSHICFAGIPFYAFDICFDGNIFRIFRIHRQDTDKDMFSNMETLIGIAQPVKGKVSGRNRGFHAKDFYPDYFFGDS